MADTATHDLVAAAASLAPQIRAARLEMDDLRHLPTALGKALGEAGLLQLCLPKSMGGPQLDPLTAFCVIEELSRADGSVGWCGVLSNAGSLYPGWLDAEVGRNMFGQNPNVRMAGSFRPEGFAHAVDGGYRVSGRWDYASGINHANWLFANCKVMDADGQRRLFSGAPEIRMVLVPADEATVYDTWSVVGLRGTGSNDFVLDDVLVPADRTFVSAGPSQDPSPLYDPRLFFVNAWTIVAGCPLGMARGAMDAFIEMAGHASSTTSTTLLRDRASVHSAVGEAEAIIGAARSYLMESTGAVWRAAHDGTQDFTMEIARARLAITHGAREAVRAVDLLFNAAGTNSIWNKNLLERFFRDIHVAVHHGIGLASNFESGGQVMLGLHPRDPGW